MKIARVVPIHKAGPKFEKENYRPISTLHFLSKVFERLVHGRLLKFFNKYDVLYTNQYGFLKNKSTTDAILKYSDFCYDNFNNGGYMTTVFLDFSKAFDTIDHQIMVDKLECYGIRGQMNLWFQSYLGDRSQFVEIGGLQSSRSCLLYTSPSPRDKRQSRMPSSA